MLILVLKLKKIYANEITMVTDGFIHSFSSLHAIFYFVLFFFLRFYISRILRLEKDTFNERNKFVVVIYL